MPTYDYQCEKCKHAFEVFQSMNDKLLRTCPECGGKVKRLIGTGAGVIFKGSGFYETDYKRTTAASSAGQEKKADTKPAEPETPASPDKKS